MFTGIIETTGVLAGSEPCGGDMRLTIASEQFDFSDVREGDSIAVSGTCLTVTGLANNSFQADVSNETLRCTSLGALNNGDAVNLEKSMTPSSRLGGHIVSGHVDGLATLTGISSEGRSLRLDYEVPTGLARYIAAKGSVCLDGVSLTVNSVAGNTFSVNIIPHTAEKTTIGTYRAGRKVNLEVDVVARYLERLLSAGDSSHEGLSLETLAQAGFVRG